MKKKAKQKHYFNDLIRITKKQKEYLRKIKGKYSMAGKLDEIINFYKNNEKH